MDSSHSRDADETCWSPWNTLEETVLEVAQTESEESIFNRDSYTLDEFFKTPCRNVEIEEINFSGSTLDSTEHITYDLLIKPTTEDNNEEIEGHHEGESSQTNQVNLNNGDDDDEYQIIREDFHGEPTVIKEDRELESENKAIIMRDDLQVQDKPKEDSDPGVHNDVEVGLEIDFKEACNNSSKAIQKEDPTIITEDSAASPHQLSLTFGGEDSFGVLVNIQRTPASVFSIAQCGPRKRPSSCCKSAWRCAYHSIVLTPTQIIAIPFQLPLTPVNYNESDEDGPCTLPNDEDEKSLSSVVEETLVNQTANIAMIESPGHVPIQKSLGQLQKITYDMPTVNDRDQKEDFPGELNDLDAYQKYGLRWVLWREHQFPRGGILAEDVGLNKLVIFKELIRKSRINEQPTLIVCSSIEVFNEWEMNFGTEEDGGIQFYRHHENSRTFDANVLKKYDVVLTTYQTIAAENPKIKSKVLYDSPLVEVYWHRIIIDSAKKISKLKLVSTQAILKLEGRHRWAVLSESPSRDNVVPKDIRGIVKFLLLKPFDDDEIWEHLFGRKARRERRSDQVAITEIILSSLIPPARH